MPNKSRFANCESVKLTLRIPNRIHKLATVRAEVEQMSFNDFAVESIRRVLQFDTVVKLQLKREQLMEELNDINKQIDSRVIEKAKD